METRDNPSSADERRKRQEALRALAEGAPLAPTQEARAPSVTEAAPLGRASRRWPRWALPLVSAVALLAIAAVAIAHFFPAPAPKSRPLPAQLALDPQTYGISCLEDSAWSPDSTKLAILGQQQACGSPEAPESYSYYPTILAVVDARTGRSLAQIHPDATVQRDLHLHAPQYITPVNGVSNSGDLTQQGARYSGLAWSPDSKRIAAPFTVTYTDKPLTDNLPLTQLVGMFVVGASGADGHATAIKQGAVWTLFDEWNMKTLKPVSFTPPPGSDSHAGSARLYPASLSYTWQADGSLTGATPLNSASAPPAPPLGSVGNPDVGASFTIWQPMQAGPQTSDYQHPIYPAVFDAQVAPFMAWSPDGTYLLSASLTDMRMQPSKQPPPAPALLKSFTGPLAPIRDAALDATLNHMSATGIQLDGGSSFAWRPDGKRLAMRTQNDAGAATVTILDCATGAALGSAKVLGTANVYGSA